MADRPWLFFIVVLTKKSNFVVTLEIRVRPDLGHEDMLELTRWAWERVVGALWGLSLKLDDLKREGDGRERLV